MLAPDYIPPQIGWPVAGLLVALWIAMVIAEHRRRAEPRPCIDCLGGRHAACLGCMCVCNVVTVQHLADGPRDCWTQWTDEHADTVRHSCTRPHEHTGPHLCRCGAMIRRLLSEHA